MRRRRLAFARRVGPPGERDLPPDAEKGRGARPACDVGRLPSRHTRRQQARPRRDRPASRSEGAGRDRGSGSRHDRRLRGVDRPAGAGLRGDEGAARRGRRTPPRLRARRRPRDRGRPCRRRDREAPARDRLRARPVAGAVPDVIVCDVGPRDGLQNEPETLEPSVRAELAARLAAAGLPRVEAVSFVRDERVPQMAGAEEVASRLPRGAAEWSGLVLNERGYERFRATGLDRLNLTVAATDSFSRRNANASRDEALAATARMLERAGSDGVPATVTVSVAFGCPFEGAVDPAVVRGIVEGLSGADEIVLADTIGVATPSSVRSLVQETGAAGFHGHNTRNTGYANALAALEAGAGVLGRALPGYVYRAGPATTPAASSRSISADE